MSHNGYFRPPPLRFPPPPFPPPFGSSSLLNPQFPPWPPSGTAPQWLANRQDRLPYPPPPIPRLLLPAQPHTGEQSQAWPSMHVVTPETCDIVKSQEDLDREWIEKFSHNCGCNRQILGNGEVKAQGQKTIKISEAKRLHRQAYSLLERLEQMQYQPSVDGISEGNELKGELDSILSILKDETVLAYLTAKVQKRTKKRERMKQKRQDEFLLRKEQEKRVKQKQEETENWLRKRYKEQENLKREQQVQKDLDDYLKEVRQKQTELRKSLELVNALGKLRKARKESAIRRGIAPSEELDDTFQCVQSSSREHLLAGMSTCEEEEKKLRSFLAEENRLEQEKIRKREAEEEEAKRSKWIKDREMVLFGTQVSFDVADPMWPIQQLHKHASSSLIALAHTRQQWDCFISDSGTGIPRCWVQPEEPASEEWRRYLEEAPLEK